ncbi:MAG: hypothetical protein AAFR00_13840, partial [Pseudomonadota bacterium]
CRSLRDAHLNKRTKEIDGIGNSLHALLAGLTHLMLRGQYADPVDLLRPFVQMGITEAAAEAVVDWKASA